MKADQGINRMMPENSPQALQMRALAATTRDRIFPRFTHTRSNKKEK
jgi:hypothetical protein